MAKFDLKAYARAGAAARVRELTEELESIYRAFPDLRTATKHVARGAVATTRLRRRRPPMSDAAKKAVSIRMKKYWATRRAKK